LNLNVQPYFFVSLFYVLCPKKYFSKEKTEKKKADNTCGHWGKAKGNGISPEGWIGEARVKPLCRSLLIGSCGGTAVPWLRFYSFRIEKGFHRLIILTLAGTILPLPSRSWKRPM
jgi:hypothetical protein